MSLLDEQRQLERRYGAKALKRLLKLSKRLKFSDENTLVDLSNSDFDTFLKYVSLDVNSYKKEVAKNHQLAKQKRDQKQREKQQLRMQSENETR